MNWLLTGGAGFIGTNLAKHLIAAGERCIVTDNFHRRSTGHAAFLDVRFPDQVDAFFKLHPDIDVIAHLAGQVSLVASIKDPRYDFDTNALGTFNVLEAARRFTPHARLIYSSTNKIYGDLANLRCCETPTRYSLPDYPLGLNESLPVDLHGGYSCSKGSADQYVRDYRKVYGLKTVALRQSTIYGASQYATEDQGWVAWFVRMGVQNSPFQICGTGKQVRDLLHVSDLCNLFLKIARQPDDGAVWGEAFNVGGGPESTLSLLELFERLRRDFRMVLDYSMGPPREADQPVFIADTSKVRKMLGWLPRTGVRQGLEELVEWTQSHLNSPGSRDVNYMNSVVPRNSSPRPIA